ncbi:methyltransferase family protein [Kribbella amoyensis]|uniref:Methyltransferase family protein n=1 Tax=Kribbella amoyensis TaxID=996641 RepID=A0A561C014_9ACTN|nr:class I SAM-dependent methyltransferase [Kribbella amoyensis]TWD84252.1 methyltransferase family protein [Kribbella amoyensis]
MTSYLDSTRASYDTVAADYYKIVEPLFIADPFQRAMMGLLADLVAEGGGGPVGDLGCGPGHVTTYLAGLGVDAFGVDLSSGMVEVARAAHPELRFEQGSLLDLDLPDNELAGALAWYSLVHTPAEDLPRVFGELFRVVRPGGLLLHGFKIGEGTRHLDQGYGHPLSLDVYRYQPDVIAGLLAGAGFVEVSTTTTAPSSIDQLPQAYLLVRKPA